MGTCREKVLDLQLDTFSTHVYKCTRCRLSIGKDTIRKLAALMLISDDLPLLLRRWKPNARFDRSTWQNPSVSFSARSQLSKLFRIYIFITCSMYFIIMNGHGSHSTPNFFFVSSRLPASSIGTSNLSRDDIRANNAAWTWNALDSAHLFYQNGRLSVASTGALHRLSILCRIHRYVQDVKDVPEVEQGSYTSVKNRRDLEYVSWMEIEWTVIKFPQKLLSTT